MVSDHAGLRLETITREHQGEERNLRQHDVQGDGYECPAFHLPGDEIEGLTATQSLK